MDASLGKLMKPKPSISLSKDDLPESADWKTGKKYEVKATIKKTGHHEDMFGGKDKNVTSHFEVHHIEPFEAEEDEEHDDEDHKEKSEKPEKGEGSQDED